MELKELEQREIKSINGGIAIATAIAIAGACIYVYNNWDDFVSGVEEGYAG